jgi:putative OPT family oligopeptide transporter
MVSKSAVRPPELTLRGIALGCFITLLFTAANLYLGLRGGLTIATSIPAAVISMALLRNFKNANIFENNIVQTIASAAGTLSAIGYVLPGLIMVGWWTGFSFWMTFWVCAIGGLLGVLFSVPLRRALVTGSDLPYPEGVAAAAVLRVGTETVEGAAESKVGLRVIIAGSIAAAFYSLIAATQIASAEITKWFRVGQTGTGVDASMSFALIGAGHLVGLTVGLAILWGLVLGFGIVTPLLTFWAGTPELAQAIWGQQVRFFGAGVIGISALWTLATLIMPIFGGLKESLESSRARKAGNAILAIEEQDIPVPLLGVGLIMLIVPMALVLYEFLSAGPLAVLAWPLVALGVVYVIIAGAIVAAVCGYMAGLIGASNSPISGVGILSIVICASLLLLVVIPTDATRPALVAFALFVTAIVFACATISNDNLQDLKTGQLVGASPRRQQIALIVGVIAGALSIPVVLNLLAKAYGFAGAANIGVVAPNPLPAPQATLIAALAQGVIGGKLDWQMIGIGALVGVGLILLDEVLGRMHKLRIPPLAVGIGIYLPMSATFAVVVGAFVSHWFGKRADTTPDPERMRRLATLVASGLIVGESLWGVVNAGLIVATSKEAPIGLVPEAFAAAPWLGLLGFVAIVVWLYRWMLRRGAAAATV